MAKKTTATIIADGSTIADDSENEFLQSVKSAEDFIYKELLMILNTVNVSAGKLQTNTEAQNFLMGIDAKILDALKKAKYPNAVMQFVKNFKLISQNIQEVHKSLNGITVTDQSIAPILTLERQNTIAKLTAGLQKDFVGPIRQSLYRNIFLGEGVSSIEKTVREYALSDKNKDSRLLSYVTQVSRDAVQQFDGSIQSKIAAEFGFNGVIYIGSLIKDSRAQCRKWVEMGELSNDVLESEITWAMNGGEYKGLKCSGMNPDTNVATFSIYRGGYNCRHRAIPTFISPKKK